MKTTQTTDRNYDDNPNPAIAATTLTACHGCACAPCICNTECPCGKFFAFEACLDEDGKFCNACYRRRDHKNGEHKEGYTHTDCPLCPRK